MRSPRIKNLPDEVLIEIFKVMDSPTLLSSLLVCKHWNELISNSRQAMTPVTLKVMARYEWRPDHELIWKDNVTEVVSLRRKFVNFKIVSAKTKDHDIRKIVEVYKTTLKSFTAEECHIDLPIMMSILASIENLERVSFRNCKFLNTTDVAAVCLRNLKGIKVYGCNLKVFNMFSASQVTSLDVQMSSRDCTEQARMFLLQQYKLKHLTINAEDLTFKQLFSTELRLACSSLKLKTLSVSCRDDEVRSINAEENFSKILLQHGSKIEELVVKMDLSLCLIKSIVSLESLKKLTVDSRALPKDIDELQPSPSIEAIVLLERIRNSSTVLAFLSSFLGLKSLSINWAPEEVFNFIADNLKLLESFSIHRFPLTRAPTSYKFAQLKSFHIAEVSTDNNWIAFLRLNPSIERISVGEMYLQAINKKSVKAITHAKNIKHVEIKGGLPAIQMFFEIVKAVQWNRMETISLSDNGLMERFSRPFYRNVFFDGARVGQWRFLEDFEYL